MPIVSGIVIVGFDTPNKPLARAKSKGGEHGL